MANTSIINEKQAINKIKSEAYKDKPIDAPTNPDEAIWVMLDRDDMTDMVNNIVWQRNQLGKEILEYFLEYNERNYDDKNKYTKTNYLEQEFDEDKSLSVKYNNEAYVDEELAYKQNTEGIAKTKDEIDSNRSVGDLILEWMKTGKFGGENADLSSFGFASSSNGFIMPVGDWDLGKSIKHLEDNSSVASKHLCAKYVREAMEAGGIKTDGRPSEAKLYVKFLPTIGFKNIKLVKHNANYATYMKEAMPGDIAVMESPKGGPGHICMYTGKQWISDFRQNRAWVYGGDCGLLYIFRYAKIMEGVQEGMLSAGDAGVSQQMLNNICKLETGHQFGYSMSSKDLFGYDNHDKGGHKTYGYGLLYTADGQQLMDQRKQRWTQRELESEYLTSVGNRVKKIRKALGDVQVDQAKIDAITCAYYNMGGFLKSSVFKMIKNNPNDQRIYNAWCHLSDAKARQYRGLPKRRKFEADWYFGRQGPTP